MERRSGTRDARLPLALITLAGLALRIAAARGGLWLDEAWSVVQAAEVRTPLGVFLSINHDNNHHLNSLWLLAVGVDAPSLLMRAPAIVAGTIAIPVAAAIAGRTSRAAAIVTALLFALSPALVTMGSEARGYAPMLLALLVAIERTDRWLRDPRREPPALTLGLCFLIGALSQLTMLFGFAALTGWVWIATARRHGPRAAFARTARLMFPAAAALAGVLTIVAIGAWHGGGFHFGAVEPFRIAAFVHGLSGAVGFGLGLQWLDTAGFADALIVLPPLLFGIAAAMRLPRTAFHLAALIGLPAAVLILHPANPGHARYYLIVSLSLLMLTGTLIAAAWRRGGMPRGAATATLALIVAGMIAGDATLIVNRRGDPAAAIAAMQARAPQGTTAMLDREPARAVLLVAAAQAHYPLTLTLDPCADATFLFADRFDAAAPPGAHERCGRNYAAIAHGEARGMSGTHWTLYARAP